MKAIPVDGTAESLAAFVEAVNQENLRRSGYKMNGYFQDEGPYRRELYPKHMQFIEAGKKYRERCMLAGNQTGKTELGAYEMACHLTGLYPTWWSGRKFDRNIKAWAAGDTAKTARGIIQLKLLGPQGAMGTGMIPKHTIEHTTHKTGVPGAIEQVWVKHLCGKLSMLEIKSYDQRREAFQGTVMDVIWLDEEPPEEIYTECLLRTMTCDGMVYMTFTPLYGVTPLVLQFLAAIDDEHDGVPRVHVDGVQ